MSFIAIGKPRAKSMLVLEDTTNEWFVNTKFCGISFLVLMVDHVQMTIFDGVTEPFITEKDCLDWYFKEAEYGRLYNYKQNVIDDYEMTHSNGLKAVVSQARGLIRWN